MAVNISEQKWHEIWAACEAVDATGTKLSMNAVKEHLGGTSFSYISPVLREYRAKKRPVIAVGGEVAEELKGIIERHVNQAAIEYQEALKQRLEEEAKKENAFIEGELAAANEQNIELEAENQRLENENHRLSGDNDRLSKQCSEERERYEEVHQENRKYRTDLLNANSEKASLEGQVKNLKEQMDGMVANTKRLEKELKEAQEAAAEMRGSLKTSKEQEGLLKQFLETVGYDNKLP
ncbi:DNA-binding protein [Candidatus Sororendozoicomonas aggregata]|uniref:DNA-binding protein n=1 Tax=Candidatus Sororendozoicomonas aggregata TaxID=3073239 RepID=UPI002ED509BE